MYLVETGFEPAKRNASDLKPDPFDQTRELYRETPLPTPVHSIHWQRRDSDPRSITHQNLSLAPLTAREHCLMQVCFESIWLGYDISAIKRMTGISCSGCCDSKDHSIVEIGFAVSSLLSIPPPTPTHSRRVVLLRVFDPKHHGLWRDRTAGLTINSRSLCQLS